MITQLPEPQRIQLLDTSLIWQITSPRRIESYLFGTMHIRDLRVAPHLDRVKTYIGATQRYYSEIEIETGMSGLGQFQQLPDGQDIRDFMSQHQYDRLRNSISRSFGLDVDRFRTLYPLILSNLIQTSILGSGQDEIMDFYLYRYAQNLGNELHFLESQSRQVALFQQIPMDYQLKSLLMLGRQPAKARQQLLALLRDYSEGKTRQLYQRSKKQLGKMRHILLYQRNVDMANTIVRELDDVSGFVGVGAAHLYGYRGILRLLKKSGFKIQPL